VFPHFYIAILNSVDFFGGKIMTFFGSLIASDISGLFAMFADQGVSLGIYDIAKSLTYPGWGVIITLLIQSVYMIAVGIERYLTYNKAKQQSRQYAPKVAQALKNGNIDEAINISDKHKDSHLAMVVSSGLKEFAAHQGILISQLTKWKPQSVLWTVRSLSRRRNSNAALVAWPRWDRPLRSSDCSALSLVSSVRFRPSRPTKTPVSVP
jgi:hypothetical protein